jgi:DNA-binding NtrC family response regulator
MNALTDKARILVVDDDEIIRESISALLEDAGYGVDTAENGKEGVEKSFKNFYNLALVDIRLPDMSGIALLTAMKETTPKMIKLIITGYPTLENAIEAVNKGADGYIVKPFKTEQLLSAIEEHLKTQGEAQSYSEQKVAEYIETRASALETQKKKT